MGNNKKKEKQLGTPFGTASNKLRKMIMFDLAKQTGRLICFHCGKEIKTIREFSIEHKIPWLDSSDPIGLFFDLENITFSHLKCNISYGRRHHKIINPAAKSWCMDCKSFKKYEDFSPNNRKNKVCKKCQAKRMRKYRTKLKAV